MNRNIEIRELHVSFRGKGVLSGLNLTVASPGVTCLIGPNGCGKTTLLRAALGLTAYRGTIRFGGERLEAIRDKVAVVLDEPPFYGYLSVRQNLKLLMGVGDCGSKAAADVFALLKIDDKLLRTHAGRLSFGQRHRVAAAGAILRDPQYIFLDEPSVGLDPESFTRLADALRAQAQAGRCILLTGHDFELIDLIADRVAVLSSGECAFSGTLAEFKELIKGRTDSNEQIRKSDLRELFKWGGGADE